jgi:transglutaminase-like putative cysteine protease
MGPHESILTDIRSTTILPPGRAITQDAMGRYILDLTDIPPIPQEPFSPPLDEKIYQVDFYYTYTLVQKDYWQKEMQFWIKDLDRYLGSSSTIKTTVSEICSPSDSPLDKAKKLYALVQKFDNVDFSRSAPPPSAGDTIPDGHVESVLTKKNGTSTEMALLYLALLRAADVNARPERIASRDRHVFSPQILSTTQLDAVVIAVNIDGKETLIDPGEKMAPFQTLHWSHTGAGGVALDASGKVEIVVTPLSPYTDNQVVRVGKIDLTPQGQAS